MAVPKPMRTEFVIHQRLESCEKQCSNSDIIDIIEKRAEEEFKASKVLSRPQGLQDLKSAWENVKQDEKLKRDSLLLERLEGCDVVTIW